MLWWPFMITITRDEVIRSDKKFSQLAHVANSKLLRGQTQNEEMQEIQTEETIGMFRNTETTQNYPATR